MVIYEHNPMTGCIVRQDTLNLHSNCILERLIHPPRGGTGDPRIWGESCNTGRAILGPNPAANFVSVKGSMWCIEGIAPKTTRLRCGLFISTQFFA